MRGIVSVLPEGLRAVGLVLALCLSMTWVRGAEPEQEWEREFASLNADLANRNPNSLARLAPCP